MGKQFGEVHREPGMHALGQGTVKRQQRQQHPETGRHIAGHGNNHHGAKLKQNERPLAPQPRRQRTKRQHSRGRSGSLHQAVGELRLLGGFRGRHV